MSATANGSPPWDSNADQRLDLNGLICPQPILATRKAVKKLKAGQTLLIYASDPSFQIDCRVFARQAGHKLLKSWQEQGIYCYVLQKSGLAIGSTGG